MARGGSSSKETMRESWPKAEKFLLLFLFRSALQTQKHEREVEIKNTELFLVQLYALLRLPTKCEFWSAVVFLSVVHS